MKNKSPNIRIALFFAFIYMFAFHPNYMNTYFSKDNSNFQFLNLGE